MEYTQSNMSRFTEAWLLIKHSFMETKGQAERAYHSYRKIADEFDIKDDRVMEIGAGSRGSLIQMFGESNDVIGIDKYLGALEQGYWKALKTFTRQLLFDPLFYHYLSKLNGGYLNRDRKVINMDAMKMAFQDNEFDFIYSRFLLEHIEDIATLASEIHRVLKPGGKTYHAFALYSTLDGAHTLDWKRFEPWQHLTGRVDSNAYVNKYRLSFYKENFEKEFGLGNVEVRTRINEASRRYLTPELRARLESYSEEELLTSSPVIVATKQE